MPLVEQLNFQGCCDQQETYFLGKMCRSPDVYSPNLSVYFFQYSNRGLNVLTTYRIQNLPPCNDSKTLWLSFYLFFPRLLSCIALSAKLFFSPLAGFSVVGIFDSAILSPLSTASSLHFSFRCRSLGDLLNGRNHPTSLPPSLSASVSLFPLTGIAKLHIYTLRNTVRTCNTSIRGLQVVSLLAES